jgi:hypothetical protein
MHVHTSKEFLNAMAVDITNFGVLTGSQEGGGSSIPTRIYE